MHRRRRYSRARPCLRQLKEDYAPNEQAVCISLRTRTVSLCRPHTLTTRERLNLRRRGLCLVHTHCIVRSKLPLVRLLLEKIQRVTIYNKRSHVNERANTEEATSSRSRSPEAKSQPRKRQHGNTRRCFFFFWLGTSFLKLAMQSSEHERKRKG